jgi:hypothetical protein
MKIIRPNLGTTQSHIFILSLLGFQMQGIPSIDQRSNLAPNDVFVCLQIMWTCEIVDVELLDLFNLVENHCICLVDLVG